MSIAFQTWVDYRRKRLASPRLRECTTEPNKVLKRRPWTFLLGGEESRPVTKAGRKPGKCRGQAGGRRRLVVTGRTRV